jgi:antitoxin component YwqK of YwqJK toxin-antitoxin module
VFLILKTRPKIIRISPDNTLKSGYPDLSEHAHILSENFVPFLKITQAINFKLLFMSCGKVLLIFCYMLSVNAMGQQRRGASTYGTSGPDLLPKNDPLNSWNKSRGDLQSGMPGNQPSTGSLAKNNKFVQNNNWPSGANLKNSILSGQYQFISSVQKEGNYWVLVLKDSSNTTRLKGSYIDQDLTIPEGMFYYYHSNGNVSMYGQYNQGLKNSTWISNYANGKLKDSISYINGKKNGLFKRFHLNGTLFVSGNFLEDSQQGTWLEYYQNGQPASISNYNQNNIINVIYYTKAGEKIEQTENIPSKFIFFNNRCEVEKELINANYYGIPQKSPRGNYECTLYNMEGRKIVYAQWSDPALTKKDGLFELYDTTGNLGISCYYDNNQLNGVYKTWHETGILADSGLMKKNMANGIWESWYASGMKKDSGEYINNIPANLWTYWDENGNTRTIGVYGKSGKIGEWKTYDRNGRILFIERYRKSKNGEPEKIIINQ